MNKDEMSDRYEELLERIRVARDGATMHAARMDAPLADDLKAQAAKANRMLDTATQCYVEGILDIDRMEQSVVDFEAQVRATIEGR